MICRATVDLPNSSLGSNLPHLLIATTRVRVSGPRSTTSRSSVTRLHEEMSKPLLIVHVLLGLRTRKVNLGHDQCRGRGRCEMEELVCTHSCAQGSACSSE